MYIFYTYSILLLSGIIMLNLLNACIGLAVEMQHLIYLTPNETTMPHQKS